MNRLKSLWCNLRHRGRVERDLDDELRETHALLVEEKIRTGMTPNEASRAASLELGGREVVADNVRDVRRGALLDGIVQDIRCALRQFRKKPGYVATVITIVAVGIGVNGAVFTLANGSLFSGYPNLDPSNRIVYITGDSKGPAGTVSYPDFEDWRTQATSFNGLLAVVLSGGARTRVADEHGGPGTYDATQLSANSFRVLGQQPIVGRDFTPGDEMPGAAPVVMLSHHLWEQRYHKDPAIVGRSVRMNSTSASWGAVDLLNTTAATVIGVMPPGFEFPHHRVDLWLPLVPTRGVMFPDLHDRRSRRLWFAFGRLTADATVQTARAEMEAIGRRLEREYPLTNRGIIPSVRSFREFWIRPNAVALYKSMWAAVAFVLLMSCANLANLTLARAMGRSREVAVRTALGAGRWRIIRQFVTESLLLSIGGGVLGWVIARWAVRTYNTLATPPNSFVRWNYAIDYWVLGYLAFITLIVGLVFGLAPAMRLSRFDSNATLKDGAVGGQGGTRVSALLVAGEMALAVMLLAGAGVMIRSVLAIASTDLGVKTAGILTAPIGLPRGTYPDAHAQISATQRVTERLRALPGVESVALASHLPAAAIFYPLKAAYEIDGGAPLENGSPRPAVATVAVSEDYFETLGATVEQGRAFTAGDSASGLPVVIVNERFASLYWPGGAPIGKRLRFFRGAAAEPWLTVVGVVSNIVQLDPMGQRLDPMVYRPLQQQPAMTMWAFARTRVPPATLATAFRRAIEDIDPDFLVGPGDALVASLDQRLRTNYWSNTVNSVLFLVLAVIALLLASTGLYAVVAHSVRQRTQEIGIRTAIGASTHDILWLVFGAGMIPVGLGLAVGLVATFGFMPLLRAQLVNVSPIDPMSLAIACGVLVLSAMVGCWIPARRAIRVDPMVALRHE